MRMGSPTPMRQPIDVSRYRWNQSENKNVPDGGLVAVFLLLANFFPLARGIGEQTYNVLYKHGGVSCY
jgi:hypothetical protein